MQTGQTWLERKTPVKPHLPAQQPQQWLNHQLVKLILARQGVPHWSSGVHVAGAGLSHKQLQINVAIKELAQQQHDLANYILILMYWNCAFVIWVTSGMIGKTTAQENSEKLLTGNLYWPDMGTWGEATDVCALLVLC